MSKAIGIDLGTTFSVIAYMEKGRAVVIPSREGCPLVPSVVSFHPDGSYVVGRVARAQAVANPLQTIASIKRWMGDDKKIRVNDRYYTPQEISSFILSKLKEDAEAFLGEAVNNAVVTVPAYFNNNQRQATMEAAAMSGLDVMRIINEPTAASLAYGLHKQNAHNILVWDLGGGTFDVSILELGNGVFEVKSVNGNTSLGGDDWDQKIMDYLAAEFLEIHQVDPRQDPVARQRLKEASENAKIELSSKLSVAIQIPFLDKGRDLESGLSREKFEELTKDLLEKMIPPTRQALRDAELQPQDLDRIVLVGGSSRMPAVQQLARELFGKEPFQGINPDEVVALGAAIQAGVLSGEIEDVTLVDVTPLSLGLETMGGLCAKLIERNSAIPVSRSQIFTTARDNQTQIDIHILQGERTLASDNIKLGSLVLDDIPFAPRGEPPIEIDFQIDVNGILQVTATNLQTERQASVNIVSPQRLSPGQIQNMLKEARIHAEEDKKKEEIIRMRIRAESLISGAREFMKENFLAVAKNLSDEMEETILAVKRAMASGREDKLQFQIDRLMKLLESLSAEIQQPSEKAWPAVSRYDPVKERGIDVVH